MAKTFLGRCLTWLLALGMALMPTLTAAAAEANAAKARQLAASAQKAENAGQFVQAAELFEQAYRLRPERPRYLYRAGRARWLDGDGEKAERMIADAARSKHATWLLRWQAKLDLAQLKPWNLVQADSYKEEPTPPPKPAVPPPVVVAPKPPPVALPKPPTPVALPAPATAVALAKPATPVAKPTEPEPPRKLVVTAGPPLEPEPPPPPKPKLENTNTTGAVLSYVAAAGLAIAAIAMALHAGTLQDRLDTNLLPNSDAYDLTRVSKAEAVDRTNQAISWRNRAGLCGVLALTAASLGTYFITDDEPPTVKAEDAALFRPWRWRAEAQQ